MIQTLEGDVVEDSIGNGSLNQDLKKTNKIKKRRIFGKKINSKNFNFSIASNLWELGVSNQIDQINKKNCRSKMI